MEQDTTQGEDSQFLANYSFDSETAIIMCIEVVNKNLGVSVLDSANSTLKVLTKDYMLSNNYKTEECQYKGGSRYGPETNLIVGQLINDFTPSLCIISSRLDEDCYEYLQKKCQKVNCKLEIQSSQYFKKGYGVADLQVASNEENSILQNLLTNKDDAAKSTIATVGCIMYLLDQYLMSSELDQDEANIDTPAYPTRSSSSINKITVIDIKNKMLLDDDTFYSLQIFPLPQKAGCDRAITSGYCSLFELLDHTSSTYGKTLLKSWLTFPLTNIAEIKKRYSLVRLLIADDNSLLLEELQKCISKCPNSFLIVKQLREGKETFRTWLNLEKLLKNGLSLLHCIASFRNSNPENLITKIKTTINKDKLHSLLSGLQATIDFELSKDMKRVIILENVDEELQELRMIASHVEDLIIDESITTENRIRDLLTEDQKLTIANHVEGRLTSALFLPELGFLISINSIIEDYFSAFSTLGWEEIFRTETDTYYRTTQTESLTEKYGNIYSSISDIEIELLHKLKYEILSEDDLLCRFFEYIAELDVYQSFATVTKQRNYIEPELSDQDCSIKVIKGRHPLYETFIDNYIPNDISISGGKFNDYKWSEKGNNRIQIITGPNASGKSVYLTQLGLLTYMAQIGCYIPAVKAEIGIVDRILTRIRTQESVSKLQSSFELDSKQMGNALALCTEKSLILIDEYGKGTDVIDGPALFGSIIVYLSHENNCPRTVACTHFSELFNPDVLTDSIPGVEHYQTDVIQADDVEIIEDITDDNMKVTFLFKVKKGISKDSLGIYCAKVCGMKQQILERASQLHQRLEKGLDISDEFQAIEQEDMEIFARKQKIVKAFLTWDLDLESKTSSELLRKKLANILSGEAVPLDLHKGT